MPSNFAKSHFYNITLKSLFADTFHSDSSSDLKHSPATHLPGAPRALGNPCQAVAWASWQVTVWAWAGSRDTGSAVTEGSTQAGTGGDMAGVVKLPLGTSDAVRSWKGTSLQGEAKRGDGVRAWGQSWWGRSLESRSLRRSGSLLLHLPWWLGGAGSLWGKQGFGGLAPWRSSHQHLLQPAL